MPTSLRVRALLAVVLVVIAVGAVLVVQAVTRDAPPVAQPTAAPSPSPTPQVAQPEPFSVKVRKLRGEPADKAVLFGGKPDRRPALVKRAGPKAVRVLERYLNSMFVAPETRFTPAPVRGLLTQRAFSELSKPDGRALGINGPAVAGGRTGGAVAWPIVLYRRGTPIAVTVRYRAKMRLDLGDGLQPLVQRGTMVFVPARRGWRADMVSVRLRLPEPAPEPVPTQSPGSEPSSEPAQEQSS